LTARDIARKYENNFKQYLQDLRIQFDAHPRATDYIKEQIDIVKELEEK
jgi:cysteinyl-tRNA synthetase